MFKPLLLSSALMTAAVTAIPAIFLKRDTCTVIADVTHTFYGFPDNSPAGPGIAYDCGRGYTAGGDGSFDSPLTFASAAGEFNSCEVIYDPYLEKYLRYEDDCDKCTTDWQSGIWHIDVWTGSTTVNGESDQINCEDNLTPNPVSIVRNPGSDLTVDTTELYVKGDSPSCKTSHTYPDNNANDDC